VTSVTTGAGAIWATAWKASEGNRLVRLDPLTGTAEVLPSGSLDFLVEVGEGGLWGRGLDQTTGRLGIVRYEPITGRIDASVELGEHRNPIDLALAPGSVWVATYEEGVTRVELRPA
jgi:streptogramin lyase